MESFDVFVHAHGFYRNNGHFVPVEIGFSELYGHRSTHLVTVHWEENDADVFFTERDTDRNYYMKRCVHGIPLAEMESREKCFMSVDLKNLKLFLLAKIGNKRIGYSGRDQGIFLKKYLNISYRKMVDVDKHLGKILPDEDAPTFHENFHLDNKIKNCAGRIAWTNAKCCREYLYAQNAEENLLSKEAEDAEEHLLEKEVDQQNEEYWNERRKDDDWTVPPEDKNWIET